MTVILTVNIEYKKLRSATNILGDFCYFVILLLAAQINRQNSAGAVIKLPWHVYSPNSEASVSNDGKIPGFRFFCFCFFLYYVNIFRVCGCVCGCECVCGGRGFCSFKTKHVNM